MHVEKKQLSETKVQLNIESDPDTLTKIKKEVLEELNRTQVKLQGFRKGKAPLALVEKQLDPSVLQSEFLDKVIGKINMDALIETKTRPVEHPHVTIKKFVPFTTLEIEATVESIGDVTLPDYKKMKLARSTVKITDSDVQDVVESLRIRAATRKEVKRVAAINDEVLIDFEGTDAKTKEPIQGADGKAYPLILGSNAFIPGFEDNVIGMKAGEEKSFVITFPKDYGVAELQNKKVNFKTTAATVSEMVKPEITDAFAATVGPFKTVDDLKADVKKQLGVERQQQAERAYENELIDKIAEESQVALPKTLVDEEIERIISEERQNAVYRGQTWNEYLDGQGVKEDVYQELKRPIAEKRVKASLMLSAVAEKENIDVTKDELEIRLQLLKGQYTDKAMQDELNKPENRREIVSRLVTEKTVNKLKEYASN